MNPGDFLGVADRLRAFQSEAELRTSVGRSYYGLYNILLESLSSRGVTFKKDGVDHWRLTNYLQRCRNQDAARIGTALQDLRVQRNDADYEMNAVIDKNQAELAYRRTQRVVALFTRLSETVLDRLVPIMKAIPPDPPRRP